MTISVSDAMTSRRLLAPFFSGPSWDTWRMVIKAMFAEKMSAAEIETFRSVAERDPPTAPVSEAVFIIGRGGGKDSVATSIATTIAVNFDPRHSKLRPGEKAVACCLPSIARRRASPSVTSAAISRKCRRWQSW